MIGRGFFAGNFLAAKNIIKMSLGCREGMSERVGRGGKEKNAANSCLQFGRGFASGITKLVKRGQNKKKYIQDDV